MTFIKNRLKVAKDLLKDDGFLCVSIDHNELGYLITLMDDDRLFGRENRLGIVSVIHKPGGRNQEKFFGTSNEFLLVYAKNKGLAQFDKQPRNKFSQARFNLNDQKGSYRLIGFIRDHIDNLRHKKPKMWYPIYINSDLSEISLTPKNGFTKVLPVAKSGREMSWKTTKETFLEDFQNNEIVIKHRDGQPVIYRKQRAVQIIKTHWDDKRYNATVYGTKHLKQLIGENHFSFPKSIHLMVDILKITTGKNDAVLDFFAGSGTTGEAVLRLNQQDGGNRQFVLIEQLQEHIKICLKRLTKTLQKEDIDDDFIYCELAKLNQATIERIQNCVSDGQLEKTLNQLQSDGFLRSEFNFKKLKDQKHDWDNLTISNKKEVLLEALDPNQTYLNLSEIDDIKHNVSPQDKILMRSFYDQKPQSSQKQSN